MTWSCSISYCISCAPDSCVICCHAEQPRIRRHSREPHDPEHTIQCHVIWCWGCRSGGGGAAPQPGSRCSSFVHMCEHGWLDCICVACVHMSRISCISGDVLPVCRPVACVPCMSCGTCAANVMSCAWISLCPCLRQFLYQVPSLRLSSESSLPLSQLDSCIICCHGEQPGVRQHLREPKHDPEHTIQCHVIGCWGCRPGGVVGGAAAPQRGENGDI